jgi:hypothetical protein
MISSPSVSASVRPLPSTSSPSWIWSICVAIAVASQRVQLAAHGPVGQRRSGKAEQAPDDQQPIAEGVGDAVAVDIRAVVLAVADIADTVIVGSLPTWYRPSVGFKRVMLPSRASSTSSASAMPSSSSPVTGADGGRCGVG